MNRGGRAPGRAPGQGGPPQDGGSRVRVEVDEASFEQEVLVRSAQVPVILELVSQRAPTALTATLAALAEDFNTPKALAALFELIAEGNRRSLPGARVALEEMLPLLGLETLLEPADAADSEAEELMREREAARGARDFELADRLREELSARGFEVRDTSQGPRLVRRAAG